LTEGIQANGRSEIMSNGLFAEIDEAKKVGTRLVQRRAAAKRATKRRDNSFYKLFATLHRLDNRLRKLDRDEALKQLKEKYGNALRSTKKSVNLLLKLTCPGLSDKTRWKYAATLRYVRDKKAPEQSIRNFLRANGGIKGCVEKEKKLREKRKRKASDTK
jgi:hypothetical protein